jgi:cytochrome P450
VTTASISQAVAKPIDITTRFHKADPFPFYAELRADKPIARARFGNRDAWLVTRYNDVLDGFLDPRLVKSPMNVRDSTVKGRVTYGPALFRVLELNMLDQDDPVHARLRKLVHKAFTPARIEQLQTRIQVIADQLLDAALKKREMNLVADFALPLPLNVIGEMLGVPAHDYNRFASWSKQFLKTPNLINMTRMAPALWSFLRYFRALLEERRANPQDDMLTALVQAEEEGDHLNRDELLAMVFILLVAGHETTVNLIASGTLALLQFPDQLARLRTQPELMKPAIEELLRFTNPVETATERYAQDDMVLLDTSVGRGELVLLVIASANRDETVFSRPDEVDIAREKNRHLAFGHGAHYCLGAPLARLEGQIAFNTLLRRLPNLQLAVPPERLVWRATPTVRGLQALPVRF